MLTQKKDRPLIYTDIPHDVLQQAQEILNTTIRPAAIQIQPPSCRSLTAE